MDKWWEWPGAPKHDCGWDHNSDPDHCIDYCEASKEFLVAEAMSFRAAIAKAGGQVQERMEWAKRMRESYENELTTLRARVEALSHDHHEAVNLLINNLSDKRDHDLPLLQLIQKLANMRYWAERKVKELNDRLEAYESTAGGGSK